MKQVYYIMKAELQSLFYSPIAWLILVVFTIQCSVAFCDTLDSVAKAVAEGQQMPGLTLLVFSRDYHGWGVFHAGCVISIFISIADHGVIQSGIGEWIYKITGFFPGEYHSGSYW